MTSPSEATAAEVLTADNVAAYAAQHADEIGVFEAATALTFVALQGGNINFVFCLKDEEGKSIFIKQAPEFAAVFGPSVPLTSTRMDMEIAAFEAWGSALGPELQAKYLPRIHFYDASAKVVVMEYLDGFSLLDHDLVHKGVGPRSIAEGLGDCMGRAHAATHSATGVKSADEAKELARRFENRAMRDLQLEFVFSKAYRDATEEQRAELMGDAFLAEVAALKAAYDGKGGEDNLALCHGDLHPGSVMVGSEGTVKIIDPEFVVYGPPGLDVGSLLSGYVLAAVHHAFLDHKEIVRAISDACSTIWTAYAASAKETGMMQESIDRVEVDAVGFAVAEVCRTVLGFAGARVWLQFEDPSVKGSAIAAALGIVGRCMVGRHKGGLKLLLAEVDALV